MLLEGTQEILIGDNSKTGANAGGHRVMEGEHRSTCGATVRASL